MLCGFEQEQQRRRKRKLASMTRAGWRGGERGRKREEVTAVVVVLQVEVQKEERGGKGCLAQWEKRVKGKEERAEVRGGRRRGRRSICYHIISW